MWTLPGRRCASVLTTGGTWAGRGRDALRGCPAQTVCLPGQSALQLKVIGGLSLSDSHQQVNDLEMFPSERILRNSWKQRRAMFYL